MTTYPHLAFGLFSGAALTSCHQMSDPAFVHRPDAMVSAFVAVMAGSLAPDVDAPGTPASRAMPFIAREVQSQWPHRTMVHSLLGALLSSLAVLCTLKGFGMLVFRIDHLAGTIAVFWLVGFAAHLVVDSLTVSGVRWLWPYHRAFAYPSVRQYRIRTGDRKWERRYTIFFLGLFAVCLPVLKSGGAAQAIHRTFREFRMAKRDYLDAPSVETHLSFEGSYRHNRAPASGKALILDVRSGAFLVYLNGRVTTVGDQALILGTEYVCDYTQDAPDYSETSFAEQSWQGIQEQIPEDVLVAGRIVAQRDYELSLPVYTAMDYPTIESTGLQVVFNHANPADIISLNVREAEDIRKLRTFLKEAVSELRAIAATMDSLTEVRNSKTDLTDRHHLKVDIEEAVAEHKSLQKRVDIARGRLVPFPTSSVLFSGKLGFRKTPRE